MKFKRTKFRFDFKNYLEYKENLPNCEIEGCKNKRPFQYELNVCNTHYRQFKRICESLKKYENVNIYD